MKHSNFPLTEKVLRDVIWSHRLKATSARLKVLSILSKEHRPISVEFIRKKDHDSIDLGTLYRILETFTDASIVNKIDLKDAHAQYELAFGRAHHHHIVCTKCGLVEDVHECDPVKLQSTAYRSSKDFSSITRHSLEFFGVCTKCSL